MSRFLPYVLKGFSKFGLFQKRMLGKNLQSENPRHIYAYWDSGLESAPAICQFCVDSWRQMNPTWEVTVLDRASADAVMGPAIAGRQSSPNHYSDMLRMKLLRTRGGVWVDATLLCTRPLDDWLPMILNQTPFFAFSLPYGDRVISSWFLVSSKKSKILEVWAKSVSKFVDQNPSPKIYFFLHYLFEWGLLTSRSYRRAYRDMPKLSADMCHILQRGFDEGSLTEADLRMIGAAPMQKLSYRNGMTTEDIEKALAAVASKSAGSLAFAGSDSEN